MPWVVVANGRIMLIFTLFCETPFSLRVISQEANRIFGGAFNSRCFREQLIWFKDIDYSEEVEFLDNKAISDKEVRKFLEKVSSFCD